MKRLRYFLVISCIALCFSACSGAPTAAHTTAPGSSAASPPPPSPTPAQGSFASERTPDPASEMLVTGTVTAVLDNAIEVKDENLGGKKLVVTMLDRAEYTDGVSREFLTGNTVRIIASNALAKTLPERTAAKTILENKS